MGSRRFRVAVAVAAVAVLASVAGCARPTDTSSPGFGLLAALAGLGALALLARRRG